MTCTLLGAFALLGYYAPYISNCLSTSVLYSWLQQSKKVTSEKSECLNKTVEEARNPSFKYSLIWQIFEKPQIPEILSLVFSAAYAVDRALYFQQITLKIRRDAKT